jgi:MFS family permease
LSIKTNSYTNVGILAVANAFAFLGMPLVIFIASLVGTELAPSAGWATIPVAATLIGTAAGILPVSRVTARFGRKATSFLFIWIGVLSCFISSQGIATDSFWMFCFGTFLLGFAIAAVQQFRYAAIECLGPERAPTAASIILSGGIFAGIAGPELALMGKDLTATEFQGSFWMAAACMAISSLILLFFKAASVKKSPTSLSPQSIGDMMNPGLYLAICSGAVGFFLMTFIMTATPISMHHHFMHSLEDTKFVIQSHILAMFTPALVSPLLFRLFGTFNMMKVGVGAYILAILVGLFFTSVLGFWVQLVLLGIGWSFLFIAGTAMLSSSYRPEARLKAQALNDGLIFGLQAVASVGAGLTMARVSWAGLVSIGFVPLTLLLATMIWFWFGEKRASLNAGSVV